MDIIRIQADTGSGPVPFTNVPNPVSKPSEQSAQAESNNLAGMSSKLPSGRQSNKTSKHNGDSEVLTTSCLFCTNSVVIGSFRSASQIDNGKAEELNQVIRKLCSHMQIEINKLPNFNDYTKIKFPFCKSCDALLETIRRYQKIIEAAEATITETVFKIEQIVAVSELGRLSWNNATSSSAGAIEQKKCFPLRNMILEVIRSKFNQNTAPSSSVECSSKVHQNGVSANSQTSAKELPIVDQNDVDESRKESEEELPVMDKNDVDQSSKESEQEWPIVDQNDVNERHKESQQELPFVNQNNVDASNKELEEGLLNEDFIVYDIRQVQALQREHTEPNSNTQNESLLSPNARYNVDNSRCTSDVIENNEDCSSPPQHDEENYPGSDEIPTPRTQIGNKRRKVLIKDVRTVEETRPEKPADYVKCINSTDFISISEKRKLTGCTMKNNPVMDLHRAITHAKENCLPCKPLPPVVTPKPIYTMECDICGRPVKGGKDNLIFHKFTHKNDEEREAALQAGEWGARKRFLSRKRVIKSKLPPVSTFVFTTY